MRAITRAGAVAAAAAAIVAVAIVPGAAAAAGRGGGGCHEATEGTGPVVELLNVCFTPTVLRVEPGTTVTFVNRDPMPHDLAGIGWGWGALAPGEEATQRFEASGTYAYSCYLHIGMSGVVVVGDGVGTGPVVSVTTTTAAPPTTTVDTVAAGATGEADSDDTTPLAIATAIGGIAVGAVATRVVTRRR